MASAANTGSPQRVLVTGCAGFIGSHLADRLLADGHEVVGIDCFADYYSRSRKEANLTSAREHDRFSLIELDLARERIDPHLEGVGTVFHLAAQPGVRSSWGTQFGRYLEGNVAATQRLLEAIKAGGGGARLIYSSSSSVYGNALTAPTREDAPLEPISPYGTTKLAGEHLCRLYDDQFGLASTVLRFFTVYGPRQRPDMAFARWLEAGRTGQPISVYGDGRQRRDFTYVADIVEGCLQAAAVDPGGPYNLGGGGSVEVREVLDLIARLVDRELKIDYSEAAAGDVRSTRAATDRAGEDLGYSPATTLEQGLAAQLESMLE